MNTTQPNYWLWLGIGGLLFLGGNTVINLKDASENEKKYAPLIAATEQKYGIPTGVLHKLIKAESAFKASIINGTQRSRVGALGIAQFMPATAIEELGSVQAALDPLKAIDGAGRYLKKIYAYVGKDWTKAVAGYNWGMGYAKNRNLATAPQETKDYVKKILGVVV